MPTASLLLAQTTWEDHMSGWGPGWWIVMAVMMVLFWGLVAAAIVWLVRYLGERGHRREPGAIEMLDRRLALGEISVEEYEERRRALAGHDGRT